MNKILRYRRTALIVFGIWTFVGLAFSGVELIAQANDNRPIKVGIVFLDNLLRAYAWGALSPLVYLLAQRFALDPRRISYRNLAWSLLFGIVLSHVYSWITIALALITRPTYLSLFPTYRALLLREIVYTWYILISFYLPTYLTIQALLLLRSYRSEEAKNAALQAEVSKAQLSALKMQLHPHFLFNALHAVSSLVLVDPARANKMVALLGDFLRQTLDHSNDQIVTLEDELGFLRNYLEIEETRFEDRLTVRFEIEKEALSFAVPHLIMQPLVENAVKHGIAPFAAPGSILISAQIVQPDLLVRIEDSGSRESSMSRNAGPKNGVGIANVRSRLAHIYGDRAGLTITEQPAGGYRAELRIPLGDGVRFAAAEEGASRE